jgi:hypothetical protein
VLDRVTPELCDAVFGREDSAAVLAEFARSNMFPVALDARERWYRYHHLFGAGADVLSVGALASLAQALFFAGTLDEMRRIAVQAVERPDAPDPSTAMSEVSGCSPCSTPSKGEARLRRRGRVRRSASHARGSKRTPGR